jgi:hypothetical protein
VSKTFVVECFWPDVRPAQIDEAAARLRRTTAAEGDPVAFTGSIFIPGDEVVFYLFEGDSEDAVRDTCMSAAIRFERVVESITCDAP